MLQIEQPPIEVEADTSAYLNRMFVRVDNLFRIVNVFSPRKIYPEKPRIGGVYYFEAAIPATDITDEGLWLYKSTGWIQLG